MKNKPKPPGKTNMTVSIDTEYYNFLKKISYKLSAEENQKIGLSELVRRALNVQWSIPPNQLEMDLGDLGKLTTETNNGNSLV